MIKKLIAMLENLADPKENSVESQEKNSQLAALGLMFQLGGVDQHLDDIEREQIKKTAINLFRLSPEEVNSVIEEAESLANDSTSLYEFTHYINEQFDEKTKFRLMEHLWKLAHADNQLCKYEEHFIRRVADLIYVHHDIFIQTKLKSLAQ